MLANRGSSVLSRIGGGHTSYYTSDCARNASDQFLLTKSPPAPVCTT
ncbi:alpha/beta hydrolase [Kribbella sancticallisti]